MQSVFEELTPQFEKASGHKLSITFGLSPVMAKRIQDGETADLVVSTRGGIDGLIKSGKVVPGSDSTLVRSSIGIAVRKGTPRPDISTPEGLKSALLSAKAISYGNPAAGGPGGVHFAQVLERLGIADEMKGKTKFPPPGGFTVQLLLRGEVDLAIQQISELTVEGAEVVGPLPGDLQSITVYATAVPMSAREPDAARALINFLRSPGAIAVVRGKGLDPN
jgi:molybdate transport system substrate-binding protein